MLKTQEKYYLSDVCFQYALFGFKGTMVASLLENIVFLEMKRRGYDVYVGKLGTKEIDFVAKFRDSQIYVQVCRSLPDDSQREVENLLAIKDNYPKYVVSSDALAEGNDRGVRYINIVDFLMMEQW